MSRKKGAAVAIIAVVAVIGGLAAYSSMSRQDTGPAPVLTTIDREDGQDNESTTIAEDSQEQPQDGSVFANNTIIANNTIVINKPVYRNNTIIYQPITINLENYRTTINQHVDDSSKPADKSHSITIHAKRVQSDGWSAKFTDDRVGMFTAVYDINGNLVKTGYADERGFTVKGLENRLYFVYPADCDYCNGSKNDIKFKQWEDGSKDRPRLVPADSDVTASYRLVVPEKQKQVPITPPPGETETAAEPEITLQARNATYVYGWVQVSAQVENRVDGFDDLSIRVYAPNGNLHDSFSYPEQQGFFASREAGEGNYRIVATYEYDDGTVEAAITHPIKFANPEWANLSAAEDDGAVRVNGMLKGGLAGENVTIAIRDPDGQPVRQYELSFGTKPVFSLFIASQDAQAIFSATGNYTFVATHVQTGVQGSATMFHDAGETETAASPVNVSDNPGRSAGAAVAAQGSKVYLVWEDDESGRHEILFAKSDDSGSTFSQPVEISQVEKGSAQAPDIAVSGDSVYVVWADYDSAGESTAAFVMSRDGGETFGNKTVLGSRLGEGTKPHVVLFKGDVYVSWITGAEEEFTGNLMLARSQNGVDFEAASIAQEVGGTSMASSASTLYLAWRHHPTGNTSEESENVFAKSGNGVDFETYGGLQEVAVTSLAASGSDLYAAGFANNAVIFAKSGSGSAFNVTEISSGTQSYVVASGGSVYLAWVQDGDVFLASSSDRGATFGEAENISRSEGMSHLVRIAAAENTYVAWTEDAGGDTDIMLVAQ